MKRILASLLIFSFAAIGQAQMSGPMMTTTYYPLVDGARYDYVFASGPHAAATGVMHAGQRWAGASGLTSMHMTFVCRPAAPCSTDAIDFYRMDADGMHYFGGDGQTPDGQHYMMGLMNPEWLLKNPVTPGTMMGPGMGYQNAEGWQAPVSGMNSMMGAQGYMSTYQAQALETVVTPAGTFVNSLHVQEHRGSGYVRDVWYAPGVGMVRWRDAQEEALLSRMTLPSGPVAKMAFAVEYYDSALDHYFVTADPAEISALDSGRYPGWQRTGLGFNVIDSADTVAASSVPVCRFYGSPDYGLNSHFYSASADECAAVQRNWPLQWALESLDVFRVYLPDMMSGACPPDALPVYRTWNGRADTNHRYTIDAQVQMMMMARGNAAEGYGNPPIAMCTLQ